MEFPFNINPLLPDEITVVTNSFNNLQKFQRSSFDSNRSNLMQIIDNMGIASGKAQNLPMPITSFKRLQYSDHRLYVLKDGFANNMQGSVIGILKMGRKKLFVYDMLSKQHEMEPLCVLDFYVHESVQRHGYGKVLFEFMLRHEQVAPVHLAIDRPSVKFSGFLNKHYGLRDCIPQMNNFVVFHGFFRDRPDSVAPSRERSGGKFGRPPAHPASPSKRPPSSSTLGDRKTLLPTPRQTPRQTSAQQQQQQLLQQRSAAASDLIFEPESPAPSGVHSAPPPPYHQQNREPRLLPAARVESPSLSRLNWQQQQQPHQPQHPQRHHPHYQQDQQPQSLGLPGLSQQSRARSNPNLASPDFLHSGGGADLSTLKSRHFSPASTAGSPYDYQQGLRRHYSHTRLW